MRTTLNIDDEALAVARSLASQRQEAIGKVVSDLILKAVSKQPAIKRGGCVPLLPSRSGTRVVTMELVNELRDGDT